MPILENCLHFGTKKYNKYTCIGDRSTSRKQNALSALFDREKKNNFSPNLIVVFCGLKMQS